MLPVLAFGEALIDMMPDYGDAVAGGAPRAFIPSPGGAPANIAVAVARLGGEAWFLGKVGHDLFGDMIRTALENHGVHTAHLLRTHEAPTALAFVAHDAHGERRFSFYRNPSADLLYRAEDFPSERFVEAGLFHVCSNTLTDADIRAVTQHGLRLARERGWLVSVDVNFRSNLWRDPGEAPTAIWSALEQADLVKLSCEELHELYGDNQEQSIVQRLLAAGARLVVVTDGDRALRFYTQAVQGQRQPPAVKAVDTTAAGDAFVGGLLYRLAEAGVTRDRLDEWVMDTTQLTRTLDFAARCGAYAAARYGAYEALPGKSDVNVNA